VNVTPSISGAATAQGVSPALSKSLSLADLLFADSPANAASDFRAIAATLFAGEGSPQTQSPAKPVITGKKSAAEFPANKPDARNAKEISDPVYLRVHAELFVPAQNAAVPLIQVSAKPDAGDDRPLNSSASDGSTQLGLGGLPAGVQIKGDAGAPNPVGVATSEDYIPPSTSGKNGTPSLEPPGTNDASKSSPTNSAVRKQEVEPAKSPSDRSQPPSVPQSSKPPAPSLASTDRAKQGLDPSFVGVQEKLPPTATDALPPAQPVEQTFDAPANKVLDSVAAAKAIPPSGLVNSVAVSGSGSAPDRKASSGPAKIKGRDIKDSRMTPAQSGKPGFIQTGQAPGGTASASNGKDFSGLSLSGHSNSHAKPAALKSFADAPSSPASLMDADGPDETIPTSVSSPVTAKLVQGMSQSEFRVGMQSQEFGNIDIRTSVARHMFSAQISVEHSDVAKSLTAQLPGLYHRLADQQVAVGNIVIHGHSLGTSSGLAQDAQRQSWQPQSHGADDRTAELTAQPILPVMTEAIDPAGRLDIRI